MPLTPDAPVTPEPAPRLGIYIHWPLCTAICPYCDFNVARAGDHDPAPLQRGLIREIESFAADLPGARVDSIFFGGGTPSLMSAGQVAELVEAIARRFRLSAQAEISLEANPESSAPAHLADLRQAGVTRLSLGVQALDDRALKALGRRHDAARARGAIAQAGALFERFSFDLIYARPGQTPARWRAELAEALNLARDHLSLYQLSIEPGTGFARAQARGQIRLPDGARAAALYEISAEMSAAAGLAAYEISNHARPGGACRHNLAVWRGGDYLGIGPGAHGRMTRRGRRLALRARRDPRRWLAAVEARGRGIENCATLSAREVAQERLITGLRLSEGVRLSDLAALNLSASAIAGLVAAGFLRPYPDRLQASARGRLVLDSVLRRLLAADPLAADGETAPPPGE